MGVGGGFVGGAGVKEGIGVKVGIMDGAVADTGRTAGLVVERPDTLQASVVVKRTTNKIKLFVFIFVSSLHPNLIDLYE
jgi:hypothetical protein